MHSAVYNLADAHAHFEYFPARLTQVSVKPAVIFTPATSRRVKYFLCVVHRRSKSQLKPLSRRSLRFLIFFFLFFFILFYCSYSVFGFCGRPNNGTNCLLARHPDLLYIVLPGALSIFLDHSWRSVVHDETEYVVAGSLVTVNRAERHQNWFFFLVRNLVTRRTYEINSCSVNIKMGAQKYRTDVSEIIDFRTWISIFKIEYRFQKLKVDLKYWISINIIEYRFAKVNIGFQNWIPIYKIEYRFSKPNIDFRKFEQKRNSSSCE